MLKSYLKYCRNRVNAHGLHSPFLFEFYNEVIKKVNQAKNPALEELRKVCLVDRTRITVRDFGAGSRKSRGAQRTISEITRNAAIPKKQGQLLARIIDFYGFKNILELGTSLGLSTGYLSMANENASVVTIEGCPNVAKYAQDNLQTLGVNTVEFRVGEFSEVLEESNFYNAKFDLIYLDGNHQYQPTINYFDFAVNHTGDDAFIILDDIHWSAEMEKAWEEIKASNQVNVTMDLFGCGIACKRPGQRKEHFVIKF